MESFKLIRPEHLNHYGYLFGGTLLRWVDEIGWIAASLDHPGYNFVTVGMDSVAFKKSVKEGSIIKFSVNLKSKGNTSVHYSVVVSSRNIETGETVEIFSTNISFVCLDDNGKKRPVDSLPSQ